MISYFQITTSPNVKRLSAIGFLLLLFFLLFSCTQNTSNENDTSNSEVKNGMVVSAHPEATKIGIEVLKKGGNAVDASVAVGFALAVCYPAAGNIGGGGFMVIRLSDGKSTTLDFRETAPAAGHRNMFLDSAGNVIDRQSLDTQLSSGTPGSVDGMIAAHESYGKLPFVELIQPAINLAHNGFGVTAQQAKQLNELKSTFLNCNSFVPAFVKENGLWIEGDTLIQKEMAKTLELIRDKGRAGFYEGQTAELIVAEMKRGNGLISMEDLKNYKSKWREPIVGYYKDFKITSMPPPSSGGVALIQLLKMVKPFPLDAWECNKTEMVQLLTEAERRVYADRAEFMGDIDFYPVPLEGILDDEYIRNRMEDYKAGVAGNSEQIGHGNPPLPESEETTHYSIVDKWHNAVSTTTTINRGYGSKIVVKGAGFLLNNEMDDFSMKPGVPNSYGLIGGEANAIEANKRMLSSMTPTIIEKNDKLFMVVGSPGGSTIITSVFQTILNVIENGMTIQEAVASKRFHHQWLPDYIFAEKNAFDSLTTKQLNTMGYQIKERGAIGRVDAILITEDGVLKGGADPRGDDTALGY